MAHGVCTAASWSRLQQIDAHEEASTHVRSGPAQWLAEAVATLGLLLVVIGHRRAERAPWMVACWIGAAYWFTALTSFANPAITIARSLTNTFSGIRPVDAPGFIAAQLIGAIAAYGLGRLLFPVSKPVAATPNMQSASSPTEHAEADRARRARLTMNRDWDLLTGPTVS